MLSNYEIFHGFFFQLLCKCSAVERQTGASMCGSVFLSTDNGHR